MAVQMTENIQAWTGNMAHPSPSPSTGGDIKIGSSSSPHVDTVRKPMTRRSDHGDPPEEKATQIAVRLAVLAKMSAGLGALGFIWATVVLLGGFSILLSRIDFSFIIIILFTESARIFSRSHEIQWRLQTPWTITDSSFKFLGYLKLKTHDSIDDLPLDKVILSRNFSKLFYWLQLLSALSCVTLSVVRLVQLSHGDAFESISDTDVMTFRPSLYVFYLLAMAEAFLSLLEKAYAEWKIWYRGVLEGLQDYGLTEPTIERFFLVAYLHCLQGSVFDTLNLDFTTFATELLVSDSSRKQLMGVQILKNFSNNPQFSKVTLRKIAASMSVLERLVSVLKWKNPEDEDIREIAAEIVAKVAEKKCYSLQVAGFPGALVYISSLLYTKPRSNVASNEIEKREIITLTDWGFTILDSLSRDYDNCEKIAHTRGLLPKILIALKFEDLKLRQRSAKILSNLCKFVGKDRFVHLMGVSDVTRTVLRAIMSKEKEPQQEIHGLATQLFGLMIDDETSVVFNQTEFDDAKLAMEVLETSKVSETKRFAIKLAIYMMTNNKATNVEKFKDLGMEEKLHQILRATSPEKEKSLVTEAHKLLRQTRRVNF